VKSEIEAAAERVKLLAEQGKDDPDFLLDSIVPFCDDAEFVASHVLARLAADRAERESAKDRPLSCEIVEQQLVIRIGLATLKHAAEHCPFFHDGAKRFYPPYCEVADAEQLAKDVRGELLREEEDGETELHRLLDAAIVAAWEQGSTAFAAEEGGA